MLRLVLVFCFFIVNAAMAHQPKLVYSSPSKNNPSIVEEPEISKAYYGKLPDDPHYFIIDSNKKFLFYTGILTPKVGPTYNWLSLEVINKNNKIVLK